MGRKQETLAKQEKKIKILKRKNLQEILGLIKQGNDKLYDIGKKWWDGDEVTLRDKQEFYHTRLSIRALEAKKVEYSRDNICGEYVEWYTRACSADNKAFRDSRK